MKNKKLLASVLSASMLFSTVSVPVLAAGEGTPVVVSETGEGAETTYTAKIGETSYENLSDAFAVAVSGDTVELLCDVDLKDVDWSAVTASGITFDGNNHKISNLKVVGEYNVGGLTPYGNAFFYKLTDSTIKNVTFEGAEIASSADHAAKGNVYAVVCAYTVGENVFDNVSVKDSVVAGYAKVGGIVSMPGGKVSFNDCSVEGVELIGSHNKGAFAGRTTQDIEITGDSYIKDVTFGKVTEEDENRRGTELTFTHNGKTCTDEEYMVWDYTNADETTTAYAYVAKGDFWCDANSEDDEITATENGTEGTYVLADGFGHNAYAKAGDRMYLTLEAAVTNAKSGEIVTLLNDEVGAGISVPSGSNLTIDLGGHTYSVEDEDKLAGSTGSKTQIFQFLKDSTITLKNGALKSPVAKRYIQNYANLTLADVTLDASENTNANYVMSNSCGNIVLTGKTNISAADGNVAFDCYYWAQHYPSISVTLDSNFSGKISGIIEKTYQKSYKNGDETVTITEEEAAEKGKLSISGGTFTVNQVIGNDGEATDLANFLESGYILVDNGDGTYSVGVRRKPSTSGTVVGGSGVAGGSGSTDSDKKDDVDNKDDKDDIDNDNNDDNKDENNTDADTNTKFSDIDDSFWAADDIYLLKSAGIVDGRDNGQFDPEGKITRAEFTKMIVTMFGIEVGEAEVSFTDCGYDDWFTPYVAAAVSAGYVNGVSETEFAPNKTITREEACTILGRAYAKTAQKNTEFTDGEDISEYAVPYVQLLAEMGFINGYEDGSFQPKKEITRAEAAKIIAAAFRAAVAEAANTVE